LRHPVAIGFGLVTLLAAATAQATDKPACKPAPLGTAQVRSVLDGRTVQLTDGREVRLAGIEVPQKHDSAAKAALESLVSGRDIALLRLGADSDRYGRVVALVSAEPGAAEIGQSVQRALLAQGQARVTTNIGDSACAANLLEAERAARAGGLGLWADPYYVIRHAEDPAGSLRFGVGSQWLRAKSCPCGKAAPRFTSISGAVGRTISPLRCKSATSAALRPPDWS
jgi:endonuclease YncB( thermonuclease family)